ncbi:MAG: hypothetical protein H7A37_01285 [Chlamydiales bacterium]|nr:hypothetical protein [Chlamydiia bacterium]MCP5506927.1 hypothetical protein [Chlamydiales bacterium]
MIKLTINPGTQPSPSEFNKKIVIIGNESAPDTDLSLPGEKLQPSHIKIVEQENKFFVINNANDPFVTLNDLPFGKKPIRNRDILQIGKTLVMFEGSATPVISEKTLDTGTSLESIIEQNIKTKKPPKTISTPLKEYGDFSDDEEDIWEGSEEFNPLSEIEKLEEKTGFFNEEESEEEDIDVDSLLREVEQLDIIKEKPEPEPEPQPTFVAEKPATPPMAQKPEPKPHKPEPRAERSEPKVTVKASPEPQSRQHSTVPTPNHPLRSKRLWIAIAIAILSLLAIIAGGAYNRLVKKGEQMEVTAMQGVSDIAMALTYAQINQLKPEQSNWSDPEFLKKGIQGALAPHYFPLAAVDKQGQFAESPYLLRIYTSRDLSRFLVIAQPEASLIQWLAPKDAIVVDSTMMEVRKISDLRPLNRVLVNPNGLSGTNGREITKLILEGKLVPLDLLEGKDNRYGFEPPTALGLMRPGAEHLIYNAPRYARVGEKLMRAAIDITSRPASSTEVRKLLEQTKVVTTLPDAVLYTTQGMNAAIQGQQALSVIAPGDRFLIGYVRIDDDGKIVGTHMLTDTMASAHQAMLPKIPHTPEPLAALTQPLPTQTSSPEVNTASPLYTQAAQLREQRTGALTPISQEIVMLMQEQNRDEVPHFTERFNELTKKYLLANAEQHTKVGNALQELYEDDASLTPAAFREILSAVGLSRFGNIPFAMREKTQEPVKSAFDQKKVINRLNLINEASTLEDLLATTKAATILLTIDNIPNNDQLDRYQQELQDNVLDRLTALLLTPEEGLADNQYTISGRRALYEIFDAANINDPEEREFFITEFNWHLNK